MKTTEINGYALSRIWFDFCFENPEKIKPNHTALYFFAIEHCNRLGWKQKFGFPTTMVMEAIGIKSYNTYVNTLQDLVDFGFIKMIERSKNQYSANIIALSKFDKALDKALDKAFIKHDTKQSESIDSINKQLTKETIELISNNYDFVNKNLKKWFIVAGIIKGSKKELNTYRKFKHLSLSIKDFNNLNVKYTKEQIDDILDSIENYSKNKNYTSLYITAGKWLKREHPESVEKKETPAEALKRKQLEADKF
jgi:hypothetical protein